MKGSKIAVGIDVGSVSVKVALVDAEKRVVMHSYKRSRGQPVESILDELKSALQGYENSRIAAVGCTGTGGTLIAGLLGGVFANEVVAQSMATSVVEPDVRTIIEMGGEDSKLISLKPDEKLGTLVVEDFAMNAMCAAGTGSFLDQQASRLGIDIENEFAELALKSENPPRIAGRCSVFAKSDMIHLQQIATPDYDIVAGLCYAVARNFKSTVARGKKFAKPIAFHGGVAANRGVVKAFEDILGLDEGELVIGEYHATMGAVGAALYAVDQPVKGFRFNGLEPIEEYLSKRKPARSRRKPLTLDREFYREFKATEPYCFPSDSSKVDCYLGVDVGSLSTNVVLIDRDEKVVARRYLMTGGRPIEAVRRGLAEIGEEVSGRVNVLAAGTTGSGRYLTGDFIGADIVKNESTAQATAAIKIDPKVDTIFEIGGQDSKYISIDDGVVIDFEMNKACAAGTGSFIEEQAEKLGLSIKDEFSDLALMAENPVGCGERCTVFMESDLVTHQQQGCARQDLVAGLAYSIVYNYLNKVVADRRVGERIFFQGGVAYNEGVVAAFEQVTGKKIYVPPDHDVTGAIGAALLAKEVNPDGPSRFKGFDLSTRKYEVKTFECKSCSNRCTIKKVTIEGEAPSFYGSRCEKYDVDRRKKKIELPDLFSERIEWLFGEKPAGMPGQVVESVKEKPATGKKTIGLPKMLFFHDTYPLWETFFEELGFEVVASDRTHQKVIQSGVETVTAEVCFPIKVAHGHILNLMERDVDFIFLPSVINQERENPGIEENYLCPYVQATPYMVASAVDLENCDPVVLTPKLHFQRGQKVVERELEELAGPLGVSSRKISAAFEKAMEAQVEFRRKCAERGREILDSIPPDQKALVIVGRPYNGCDPGVNLDIPRKLGDMGIQSIPMDFLPLGDVDISANFPNMYWSYGQKILSAAQIIKDDPRLYAVYVTNFGCGPDSFITHFFRNIMAGKPYLQIEIDEHSADAGIITRCEAFLDSLRSGEGIKRQFLCSTSKRALTKELGDRTLYIPRMSDHAFAVAAALRSTGIKAEVIPEPDEEALDWGREFTSGKECLPAIVTTGDLIRLTKQPDFDPSKTAFFMPQACGPCRFGQYNQLHRMILDGQGYQGVPIISPSSKDSYAEFQSAQGDFQRAGWQGIVAVDFILKLLHETRPYETVPGTTEKAYWESIDDLCETIEKKGDVSDSMARAADRFDRVEIDRSVRRPRIGVVGEIYLRLNRFSNQDIIKKIEELGGEAWLAPMSEWIFYTNYMYKYHSRTEGRYKDFLKVVIKDWVQKRDERRIGKSLEKKLMSFHESTIEEVLDLSEPYLHRSFGGEAILSIGKAIDYVEKGLSGVVNIMPFTCMPGTVATAISKRVREKMGGVPWLNIAFDGTEQANTRTRLEAFVHQCKQFHHQNRAVDSPDLLEIK
jgi:predicted CoA-substrate-specific enzyme activase